MTINIMIKISTINSNFTIWGPLIFWKDMCEVAIPIKLYIVLDILYVLLNK
jgi:hypothetical protein